MALLLLICIYIAFIGLGIPDSLFGPAWPKIYQEFNIPISYASFVTMTCTLGTTISAFFASKIINRFGTRNVTIISTLLTAVGLLGYSLSSNIGFMVLSAIPLGIGAGAIDSGLNNYVALHYKNQQLNFLHCFYGIGVTLSPYLMSISITNGSYRTGFMIGFFIQLGISLILVLSYPLWNKVKKVEQTEDIKPVDIPYRKLFTLPKAIIASLIFFFYCGIEITTGVWSASYLVKTKGLTEADAALYTSLFYMGLAIGRFLAGILAARLSNKKLIIIGQIIMGISIILILLPLSNTVTYVSLALLGIGCGPIYPNMVSLTPSYYGKEYSQSIMGMQMAISYISSFTLSPLFGILGQNITFKIYPLYLIILYILMVILTITLFKLIKKRTARI